jgi:hypothetical protein
MLICAVTVERGRATVRSIETDVLFERPFSVVVSRRQYI